MLIKLAKIVKKSFQGLGKKGYTLVEVAAVVAVTATLAAVVVPVALDKVSKSKEATAADDVKALASAVAGFFGDTGVWPARLGGTDNYLYKLRTGNSASNDPTDSTSGNEWTCDADRQDFAQYHLVINKPQGSGTAYDNWAGPYAESLMEKKDPWGHNYFIWVKGMWKSDEDDFGWVISAGPDGILQTSTTDDATAGDDIGVAIYRAKSS